MDGRAPALAGTVFSSSLVHFDVKNSRQRSRDLFPLTEITEKDARDCVIIVLLLCYYCAIIVLLLCYYCAIIVGGDAAVAGKGEGWGAAAVARLCRGFIMFITGRWTPASVSPPPPELQSSPPLRRRSE